jgi:hypothetical protein
MRGSPCARERFENFPTKRGESQKLDLNQAAKRDVEHAVLSIAELCREFSLEQLLFPSPLIGEGKSFFAKMTRWLALSFEKFMTEARTVIANPGRTSHVFLSSMNDFPTQEDHNAEGGVGLSLSAPLSGAHRWGDRLTFFRQLNQPYSRYE